MITWRWLNAPRPAMLMSITGKWTVHEVAAGYEHALHTVAEYRTPSPLIFLVTTRYFPPDIIPGLRLISRIEHSHHGLALITSFHLVADSPYIVRLGEIYAALYGRRTLYTHDTLDAALAYIQQETGHTLHGHTPSDDVG